MTKHISKLLTGLLLLVSLGINAQQYAKITYIHTEADGTVFAATDEDGNLEWKIDHYPFGSEIRNTATGRNNDLSYTGKPFDEEIGLSYYGARWYDLVTGRFTGIDPAPVDPNDFRSFNRYVYGFNSPYTYTDPDGRLPVLIPLVIFVGKEAAAEGLSRLTGGATDFLSFRRLGTKGLKVGAKILTDQTTNKVDDIHRIGGGNVDNLALKARETKLDPPGISVLQGGTPSEAAAQMRAAFPNATGLHKAAECVGSSCTAKIRSAGFDVIPNPTDKFPNHFRLIHPDGAAGFTPQNLEKLSKAFKNTSGN